MLEGMIKPALAWVYLHALLGTRLALDLCDVPDKVYERPLNATPLIEYYLFYVTLYALFHLAGRLASKSIVGAEQQVIRATLFVAFTYTSFHLFSIPFSDEAMRRAVTFPAADHFWQNLSSGFFLTGDAGLFQSLRMVPSAALFLVLHDASIHRRVLSLLIIYVVGMMFCHPQVWVYLPHGWAVTTAEELSSFVHLTTLYITFNFCIKLGYLIKDRRVPITQLMILVTLSLLLTRESPTSLNTAYMLFLFTLDAALTKSKLSDDRASYSDFVSQYFIGTTMIFAGLIAYGQADETFAALIAGLMFSVTFWRRGPASSVVFSVISFLIFLRY